MSYPSWPPGLVQFERSAWQAQRQDARRRTQGDAGPPACRRRFSSAAKVIRLSLVTNRDGKAVFDQFYEVTTAEGANLFWMPDLDLSRICAAPHAHLGRLAFEGQGAFSAQG